MSEPVEKFDVTNLSNVVVGKLKELQRKEREHAGYVLGEDLVEIVRGESHSVMTDIFPEKFGKVKVEFHTHPIIEERKREWMTDEEHKCQRDIEKTAVSMVSPADVVSSALIRKPIKIINLMVSEGLITQYNILDDKKFKKFINSVKKTSGGYSEESVAMHIVLAFMKIMKQEIDYQYEKKQQFSICADAEIWKNTKTRWYNFLESIGMEIKTRET